MERKRGRKRKRRGKVKETWKRESGKVIREGEKEGELGENIREED